MNTCQVDSCAVRRSNIGHSVDRVPHIPNRNINIRESKLRAIGGDFIETASVEHGADLTVHGLMREGGCLRGQPSAPRSGSWYSEFQGRTAASLVCARTRRDHHIFINKIKAQSLGKAFRHASARRPGEGELRRTGRSKSSRPTASVALEATVSD